MTRRAIPSALAAVIVCVAAAAQPAAAATLRADYRLAGTLEPSCCGAPALANIGDGNGFVADAVRGVRRPVLEFAAGGGVATASAGVVPSASYSIAALFRFDAIDGFRRVVDFQGGLLDAGLYNLDGQLAFFPFVSGQGDPAPIAADAYSQVVITRDGATGEVVGYVNGVPQVAFTDGGGDAVIGAVAGGSGGLRFFADDSSDNGGEQSAGAVARIRAWDGPLTPAEVASLEAPDPPPRPPAPPDPPAAAGPAPNGRPASDPARLTACLRTKRPCERRPPAGRGRLVMDAGVHARLAGRLTTPGGAPIAGASLEVLARTRMPGARRRTVGATTTDGAGRYSWPVPRGPSRDLAVTYRPFAGAPRAAARASARLLVRAPVALDVVPRVVRDGGRIEIRGALPGTPRPRPGKLVELQVRSRGGWRTFATTRAGRRTGRFAHTHDFPVAGTSRSYRLRATVPPDSAYPYATGHSRAVRIRIRAGR
ncbi:MAG TPA: LamG-like jellyroll fold domain-containing protein [Thermoleophilaceae bacterium]|jgi:hypothetical protein